MRRLRGECYAHGPVRAGRPPRFVEQRSLIDLFWPGVVIVEAESHGKDLSKAVDQASDYLQGRMRRPRNSPLPAVRLIITSPQSQLGRVTPERDGKRLPDIREVRREGEPHRAGARGRSPVAHYRARTNWLGH